MVCKDSMGSLIISFFLYNIWDSVYISSRYLIGSPSASVERRAGGADSAGFAGFCKILADSAGVHAQALAGFG